MYLQLNAVKHRTRLMLLSAGIIVIDQIIKIAVRAKPVGEVFFRFASLFDLVRSENTGAAFSMFSANTVPLTLSTAFILLAAACILLFYNDLTLHARVVMAILLGGGIGNLIDRIVFGSVTDYIRFLFIRFPIFNFADICITLSVLALIIMVLFDQVSAQSGESHGTNH